VSEQFAVLLFFEDGKRPYVRRFVSAQEASRAFKHCIHNVEARFGIQMRVVITDRYDCILREWQFGKGITFSAGGFAAISRMSSTVRAELRPTCGGSAPRTAQI
jgi:hypothetical protein